MSLVQRLTPRATFTIDSNTTYQKTPNFALINAPTNAGNNGSYLNGSTTATLNYAWTKRVATVATYVLITNLLETNGQSNLYDNSYGVQFRYTASARNTITADAREEVAIYPSNTGANGNTTYLLMGLDSTISTRLRNTFSTGIESQSYSSGGGGGTPDAPYFESATTLSLPRGAGLSWTNRYGYQEAGGVGQTTTSYRTGLSYSQPLSTKLVASVSLAYNHLKNTDTLDPTAAYTETQLQASLNLGYTVTPRLSLSLSYTYNDLLTTQLNGSYQRDQVYLGGTYTFR